MSLSRTELEVFVEQLAADTERWRPFVSHDPGQRSYELIWDDIEVNAWVLCWSEDHDTGFHDHDVSAAAITVVEGQVREDRLRLNGEPHSVISGPGTTFTVPANAIHRVLHAGDVPAVTIHAYSPPLTRTGAYSVTATGELRRYAQDGAEELSSTAVLV